MPTMRVYVDVRDGAPLDAAEELAARIGAAVERGGPDRDPGRRAADGAAPPEPMLVFGRDGLALAGAGMELRGDFVRLLPRLRPDRLGGELLVKAARIKGVRDGLRAIDATAGLGEDALLLAAAGFSVSMYERDPVIAALLRDALARAEKVPELAETVSRMELHEQDSVPALAALDLPVDVVLLDPMFPGRTKSASVKKKAQLLQMLESPCADEGALMRAALAAHPRKVVVKRPIKGPYLAGIKPSYSIEGKAVRYDCIALPPDRPA